MPVYQVTYEMFCPDADEDDIRTVFVETDTFDHAIKMVEALNVRRGDDVMVKAICLMDGCEIITERSL